MAELYPFSEYVRRLLAEGPEPGRTHRWLAQVAAGLRTVLSPEACVAFLREVCDTQVRHRVVPDDEIENAVAFAYGDGRKSGGGVNKALGWPEMDWGVVRKVVSEEGKPNIEHRTSNVQHRSAGEVLRDLFRPGELVCAGLDSAKPEIRVVEEWGDDAERMQFVCVNPMRGQWGTNLKGTRSKRCQNNVRLRRHVVAEFDDPGTDKAMQAKLIAWLGKLAPLVLVVDSGGKSLHGWFRVEGMPARDQARFFAMACVLGADRTRWDVCGWLRMPGGTRRSHVGDGRLEMGDGVRQRILFAEGLTTKCTKDTKKGTTERTESTGIVGDAFAVGVVQQGTAAPTVGNGGAR